MQGVGRGMTLLLQNQSASRFDGTRLRRFFLLLGMIFSENTVLHYAIWLVS